MLLWGEITDLLDQISNENECNFPLKSESLAFKKKGKTQEKDLVFLHEKFGKIDSILSRKITKNSLIHWKNLMRLSKKKSALCEGSKLKMKLMISTIKRLIAKRKIEVFSGLVSWKENANYESIIKNIFPLTNMISLITRKLNQNLVISMANIGIAATNKQNLKNESALQLLFSIVKRLLFTRETLAFHRILVFSKERNDDFKEKLLLEFERISQKFKKIEKIQHNMRKGKKSLSPKTLIVCHPERVLSLVALTTKIHLKNMYYSWNRLRFGSEKTNNQIKSSILSSNPNRLSGKIRHLSRSHETTSLMSSDTPQRNKENSRISISNCQASDCCNEELLSAINFLNNL